MTAPLLARLEAFSVDPDPVDLPFTQRLARENGWSVAFAERVLVEYKRFVFLAMRAGHPVTPSDQVDQAWHLHLAYTVSYWDELCGEVLGRPLHHGPTRGGAEEGAKYRDWYARTLESYRRLLDQEPPADIWPDVEQRFHRAGAFRRVNAANHWIVRKPRGMAVALAAAGLGLAGCQLEGSALSLVIFVGLALVIAGVAWIVGRVSPPETLAQRRRRRRNESDDSGVDFGDDSGCGDSGCGGCGGD